MSPKLTWSLNAELEQDLSGHGPRVIATAEHIGKLNMDSDFTRTRARLSSTASYALNPKFRIDITPYVGRTATRKPTSASPWASAAGSEPNQDGASGALSS